MTQQYTPVAWQDETTSQQGTLINAERLNQMQTAHHYADGFEEVDAVPTADPSVAYHKIVYCTADSTFYRWDGTEWTKDIDDETKALLQQEIARATAAEGELAQDLADETTARETADSAMQADITAMQSGKLDKQTAGPLQYQLYGVRGSNQIMFDTWGRGHNKVPTYGIEEDLLAKMPTYGLTDDTVVNYGWANAQIGAEATARAEADTLLGGRIDTEQARAEAAEQANAQAIANTYTKAETDTLLAGKASTTAVQTLDTRVGALETGIANVYTKAETDTLLASKADKATTYTKTEVDTLLAGYVTLGTAQTIPGAKTFTNNLQQQNTNYHYGVTPSAQQTISLQAKDDVGVLYAGMDFVNYTNDTNAIEYNIRTKGSTGWLSTRFSFRRSPTEAFATFPYRAYDPAHTTDVATIGTLDAYTPMVRTTGNQSIDGIKKFSTPTLSKFKGLSLTDGWFKIIELTTGGSPLTSAVFVADRNNSQFGILVMVTQSSGNWSIKQIAGNLDPANFRLARKADRTKGYLFHNGGRISTNLIFANYAWMNESMCDTADYIVPTDTNAYAEPTVGDDWQSVVTWS